MGISHRDVARAWVNGKKATGSRMYTDGITVFSYNWPIATKLGCGKTLLNMSKRSVSTSAHTRYVRAVCSGTIECNTKEIRAALDHPDRPLVIERLKDVDTIEDGLKVLERVYHQTGAKLFPRKQLWALLEPYLVAAKLCEETAQER